MKTKKQVEKLSPSRCLRSLQAYNESVLLLTTTCKMTLSSIKNPQIADALKNAVADVESFYHQTEEAD